MKKIILSVLAIILGISLIPSNVFAFCSAEQEKNGCVSTTILGNGCSCDDGTGSSITTIINYVVDVFSIGVGILGVIGIVVVGIQYMTASGDEAKLTKAKRRMLEIVIGLALYAVMFGLLVWLRVSPE